MANEGKRTRGRSRFFANSALVMLALVVASFSFTYFYPVATGAGFAPIFHIHAVVFFGWMLLYAYQTQMVAAGRVARHREWGLAGIALSSLMLPLGVALMIAAARRRMLAGNPYPFDNSLFNIADIASFAILMTASIAAVTRHADWHRRLTFGAALALVGPALSRWLVFVPQTPPWSDMLPNLGAEIFLVALAVHDWRTIGRVHPATWCIAAVLVPLAVAVPMLITSDWWRGMGPMVMKLAV